MSAIQCTSIYITFKVHKNVLLHNQLYFVYHNYILINAQNHRSVTILYCCAPIRKLIFNPLKPEFTIVIYIHFKPLIAVTIHDL